MIIPSRRLRSSRGHSRLIYHQSISRATDFLDLFAGICPKKALAAMSLIYLWYANKRTADAHVSREVSMKLTRRDFSRLAGTGLLVAAAPRLCTPALAQDK